MRIESCCCIAVRLVGFLPFVNGAIDEGGRRSSEVVSRRGKRKLDFSRLIKKYIESLSCHRKYLHCKSKLKKQDKLNALQQEQGRCRKQFLCRKSLFVVSASFFKPGFV